MTVTSTLPAVALAGAVAVSDVLDTYVVATAVPPNFTTAEGRKFFPVIVTVVGLPFSAAKYDDSFVTDGLAS